MLNDSISVSVWVATVSNGSAMVQPEGTLWFIMSDVEWTMSLDYREGRHYSS